MSLDPGRFSEFFKAVHGAEPFAWQSRLLSTVVESGWPEILDLPTGAGKTATLDVAVFHLAIQATVRGAERKAPRRIAMIVDRRLVVDQAYERARLIASALRGARTGVLGEAAEVLRSLSGSEVPVETAWLRGGIYRDPAWARTPTQALLIASTVDQVGSRLLFRGYGVSDSMRPVHAGLLANDCLLLLDEVHLSRPFDETLTTLHSYRSRDWTQVMLPAPWSVVRLSATPEGASGRRVFRLSADDRADPRLNRRLTAHKSVRLRAVNTRGEEEKRRTAFADACGEEAEEAVRMGARTVAVVLNRVDTARRVYARLSVAKSPDDPANPQVVLLTGRMRPFDRDEVYQGIADRVRSGRLRGGEPRPLVVVATQCIEAGADFDFDALVTECASLDALRQRFGRLDRLGDLGRAPAVILGRKDQVEGKDDDPVYGPALGNTWAWLSARDNWDFGIKHLSVPSGDELESLLTPKPAAPVMLPAHLDAWVQTAPSPAADPDVALWLHGPRGGPAEVQIIWRADIIFATHLREDSPLDAVVVDSLNASPPSAAEALAVPFGAARAWLRGAAPSDIADVDADLAESAADDKSPPVERLAIRWRGEDSWIVGSATVRPGDTIVVPAIYGGIGPHLNWDPEAQDPVLDLGDVTQLDHRRRAVLRLNDALLSSLGLPPPPAIDAAATSREERAVLGEWLATAPVPVHEGRQHLTQALRRLLDALRLATITKRFKVLQLAADALGEYRAILSSAPVPGEATDVTTEPEVSSFTAVEVPLEAHCRGVGEFARRFGERCGLSRELVEDLALAGWLHDVGKADPRFQALLRGGDLVATAASSTVLAKSAIPSADARSRRRAQEVSGYPPGTRHEMMSVALVQAHAELKAQAHDWDLVLHLIASHHGHARPFAPPVEERDDFEVRVLHGEARLEGEARHDLGHLNSGLADRFWRLIRRYGWFGLAWLETILRLADHRRSEWEIDGKTDGGLAE